MAHMSVDACRRFVERIEIRSTAATYIIRVGLGKALGASSPVPPCQALVTYT
jgi:hypothetical protein